MVSHLNLNCYNARIVAVFIVDEQTLEQLSEYGYPREAVIQYLNKNELNSATTSYWLHQMARAQEELTEQQQEATVSEKK